MTFANSPMPWFGGKDRLAPRIVDLMPPHRIYVEVFGGSGAVLFAKPAAAKLEVYNDIDGGVVSFFRVLRDRPDELVERLTLTPYARAEYLDCRETWKDVDDDVERARRWFVNTWQAFGGGGKAGRRTGWASDRRGRKNGSRSATFARRVDRLHDFAHRLRHVQIEQLDWRELLDRYDDPDAVLYLDPPYVPSTRKSGTYAHELTVVDHEELVARVPSLRGTVLLSGYDSDLYQALEAQRFDRFEYDVALGAANHGLTANRVRDRRLEIVWRRLADTAQQSLLTEASA